MRTDPKAAGMLFLSHTAIPTRSGRLSSSPSIRAMKGLFLHTSRSATINGRAGPPQTVDRYCAPSTCSASVAPMCSLRWQRLVRVCRRS